VVALALVAFICAAGALLTLVGSVTREPSVVAPEVSCAPPCWNGIIPGESTYDDVVSAMSRVEGIDPETMTEGFVRDQAEYVSWSFAYPVPDSNGRIFFLDGKVAAILIGTYGSVELEEVLAWLGPPSRWWTHCTTELDITWRQTVLLWPEQGHAVVIDRDPPCLSGEWTPVATNDRVAQVIYFEPTTLRDVLQTHSLFGPDSERAIDEAQPWSPAELAP